ncbi:MAG TPA: hypothetical protein VF263_11675 [Longimicrobiaceae bacterium]
MSAFPGDPSEGRQPLPPFGPAFSRPAAGGGGGDAGAKAPLPPFMPFARPGAPAASEPPAAPATSPTVTEYSAPEAEPAASEGVPMPWEDAGLEPEPVPAAPSAEEADLPWLSSDMLEPAAESAPEPAASAPGDDEEDIPAWLSFVESGEEAPAAAPAPEPYEEPWAPSGATEADAPAALEPWAEAPRGEEEVEEERFAAEESFSMSEDRGAFAEPEESDVVSGLEDYLAGTEATAAEEAYSPGAAEYVDAPEDASGDAEPAMAGALAEVADRLEGIARALRERPGEVLAGGADRDPLELLVAGFVLGYAQGRGRG